MPSQIDERAVVELEKALRYIAVILKQKGREILITSPQFVALQ